MGVGDSRKFILDVSISFAAIFANMFIGFLISAILGRYLGVEDLGLYRIISTGYTIGILVLGLGIPSAIVKFVAESKGQRTQMNVTISAGLIASIAIGVASIPLINLSSSALADVFRMPELNELFKILAFVFPFTLAAQTMLGTLNGLREMKYYAAYFIIQGLTMAITTSVLIYKGFGVVAAVLGILFSSIASCIFLITVTKRYFSLDFRGVQGTTWKLLTFSAPILIANGINTINYQADTLLIGYFLSAAEVGYYSAAISISRLLWVLPQAIQMITYPATSDLWRENSRAALGKMVDKSMKYTACLLTIGGMFFYFFPENLIEIVYGQGFQASVIPMQILLIGTVIFGIIISVGGSVTGAGRPDLGMKMVAISASINIILNIFLIPLVGIMGAAIATSVSLVVASIVSIHLLIRVLSIKLDFRWYFKMISIITFSAVAFSVLQTVIPYTAEGVILIVYILMIWRFMLEKEDIKYFCNLVKNLERKIRSS